VVQPPSVEYYLCCLAVHACRDLPPGWYASFAACRDLPPGWGAASLLLCVCWGGAASYSDVGLLAERCRAVDFIVASS
jgi:hypothetical protein